MIDCGNPPDQILSRFGSGTLAGCVEHFFLNAHVTSSGSCRREIRSSARAGGEPWVSLIDTWTGNQRDCGGQFQRRAFEFRMIDEGCWNADFENWHLFEQRFYSGLLRSGFSSGFASGLMKVFHELADNVVQHGGLGEGQARGIAGYHVDRGQFAFSIGDIGCGYLRSLQASQSWSGLKSDREALLAVIHQGASRRDGQGEGEGFRLLWKALADHGTLVRIRSCAAVASIRPTSSGREAEVSTAPLAEGSHISVCCTLGKPTVETDLKFFFTPSPE